MAVSLALPVEEHVDQESTVLDAQTAVEFGRFKRQRRRRRSPPNAAAASQNAAKELRKMFKDDKTLENDALEVNDAVEKGQNPQDIMDKVHMTIGDIKLNPKFAAKFKRLFQTINNGMSAKCKADTSAVKKMSSKPGADFAKSLKGFTNSCVPKDAAKELVELMLDQHEQTESVKMAKRELKRMQPAAPVTTSLQVAAKFGVVGNAARGVVWGMGKALEYTAEGVWWLIKAVFFGAAATVGALIVIAGATALVFLG